MTEKILNEILEEIKKSNVEKTQASKERQEILNELRKIYKELEGKATKKQVGALLAKNK